VAGKTLSRDLVAVDGGIEKDLPTERSCLYPSKLRSLYLVLIVLKLTTISCLLRICCSCVVSSAKALKYYIIKSSAPLRPNKAAILCVVTSPFQWQPLPSPPHFGILSYRATFDFRFSIFNFYFSIFDFQFSIFKCLISTTFIEKVRFHALCKFDAL